MRRLPRNITILFSREELSYLGVSEDDLEEYCPLCSCIGTEALSLSDLRGVNEEVSDDEARVMEIMQIFVTGEEKAATVQKEAPGEDFAAVANNYNEK